MNTQKENNFIEELINNIEKINISDYEHYKKPIVAFAPKNYISKKNYKGLNALNLLVSSLINHYDNEYFLTIKQVKDFGNANFKGQKANKIRFYTFFYQEKKNAKNKISYEDYTALTEEEKKAFYFRSIVKHSYVFNLQQINNLEEMNFDFNNIHNENSFKETQNFIQNLVDNKNLVLFNTDVNVAKYSVLRDRVVIPFAKDFKNEEFYNATLLHELIHWTGADSRLNRFNQNRLVNFEYEFEELIAEIGAILLCMELDLKCNIYNSIAYIKGYLSRFDKDKQIETLEKAFEFSQKAVDFLTK